MGLSPLFKPVSFKDLPGWADDDPSQAFAAFRRSALHVLTKPHKTGSMGVDFDAFADAYAEARAVEQLDTAGARAFFERHFVPASVSADSSTLSANRDRPPSVLSDISPSRGEIKPASNLSPTTTVARRSPTIVTVISPREGEMSDRTEGGPSKQAEQRGLVTGYYEPEVEASQVRTERFTVPMYARPPDLVDVDDDNRPEGIDPYLAFARRTPEGLVEYHDRPVIDGGILGGLGLEMAWFADKVDLFFIQVQGSARLSMTDGSKRRVGYAAKTGQRFTAIGRELVNMGELRLEDVTMQTIRAWLKANPGRVDELLHKNLSYVFFREFDLGDPKLGPVGAAKVQLTDGRSVAVDRLLHTFGTPFYIDAPGLRAFGEPFRRLMIAQDTGSAIVGPARGDLFAGSGDAAGEIAGVVKAAADFYALLPKGLVA